MHFFDYELFDSVEYLLYSFSKFYKVYDFFTSSYEDHYDLTFFTDFFLNFLVFVDFFSYFFLIFRKIMDF